MSMRIQKLQRVLSEKQLFGLIIDNPIDLFYLTGLELSQGRLFIESSKARLFVDGRYYEACQRAAKIEVYPSENQAFKKFLQKKVGGKQIGFDANYTSYASFVELSSFCGKKFSLHALEGPCLHLRSVKEEEEIIALKKSSILNGLAMRYASSLFKEGILEEEIAKKIELFFLKHGGEKVAFTPIIAFGENAAECHYRPSLGRALKKGDCVLIDIGVVLNHYNSDMTRTFFFGKPHKEIKKVYGIVLEALRRALSLCRAGAIIEEVDGAARDFIKKMGYEKYFPHSLGHGVGLEIHEYPRIREGKKKLEEGMVITIEPGIYLPKIGGVRLEELILITKEGYENLAPKNIAL